MATRLQQLKAALYAKARSFATASERVHEEGSPDAWAALEDARRDLDTAAYELGELMLAERRAA